MHDVHLGDLIYAGITRIHDIFSKNVIIYVLYTRMHYDIPSIYEIAPACNKIIIVLLLSTMVFHASVPHAGTIN